MKNPTHITITATPEALGKVARENRKKSGVSLRQSSNDNAYGIRFLSEFERGKPTAELGKVIQALHAAGLDLAVVPRQVRVVNSERLSQKLNLEFPYDWSNPDISESTLIFLVLEKARFNDILAITYYFGLERITLEAKNLVDAPQSKLIDKYLRRIQQGISLVGA